MNIEEVKIYVELFYDSYRIPICCCDNEWQFLAYYPSDISPQSFDDAAENFLGADMNLSLFTDQQFLHWGYIRDRESGNHFLIGPTFSIPLDDQGIRAFMRAHTIPGSLFDSMKKTFDRIPVMPLQQFLYILRFLNYQINKEAMSSDILLKYLVPENNTTNFYSQSKFYEESKDDMEAHLSFADAYQTEQALLHYIETGNISELRQLALDPDLPMPNIGNTPMSQQKMSGIIIITVIARFVIRKGMDINTALRLSDLYLQGIESAANTRELTLLVTNAYIDYSERLQALKVPDATSPLVYNCIQYVRQMVNMPITVSDVAEHAGKSLSYVSTKFKSEMGFTLNSFITRCKIEEAKSLLEHTDMAIAEISSYLCFSDQSYFHKIFRKITGSTPLQYRERNCSQS